MNFLSEYGDLISILLAIVLAVFFYKKVAAIHYVYYSKETLFAIWNLVKGIVKTRDSASLKNALVAFVNDLPYVDKSSLVKNIAYLYAGCLSISLISFANSKYDFDLVFTFITDPLENLMVVVFFAAAGLFLKMLGLHKKDGFINTAIATMNNQVSQNSGRNSSARVRRKKTVKPNLTQPQPQPKADVIPGQTKPSEPDMREDSTQRKACYNCVYWSGQRSFRGAAGNFIKYLNEEANCAPNGGRPNVKMSPRATCNKFVKLG
jgi:hypothetical protein